MEYAIWQGLNQDKIQSVRGNWHDCVAVDRLHRNNAQFSSDKVVSVVPFVGQPFPD